MRMPSNNARPTLLALIAVACTADAQGTGGCACDHGTTALCCGQPGTPCPANGPETCSPELPQCTEYVFGKHMGMCATRESGTALCEACVDSYEEGHHPTGDNLRDSQCSSPEDPCVGPVEVGSAEHKAACCALCAVTPTCDTWIISLSGPPACYVKKGGGPTTQNKDRGVGKVSAAYLTRGCPASLANWGSPLVIVLAVASAGYVGGGSVLGSRVKGGGVAVRNHPHWRQWQELRGLCADGMAYARSGGKRQHRQPLLSGQHGDDDAGGGRSSIGKSGREKAGSKRSKGGGGSSEKRRSGKRDTSTAEHKEEERSNKGGGLAAEAPRAAAASAVAAAAAASESGGTDTDSRPAGDGGRWVHLPG